MEFPLQVTFRSLPPSDEVIERIRAKVAELERFHGRIMSCRVMIEAVQRHHRASRLYHVRIDLTVPGGELVVAREHRSSQAHRDLEVALRDAFTALGRRLEDFVRRRRAQTKRHEVPLHGTVMRLFREEGYGFLQTPDGLEVYFHRNAVVGDAFDELQLGSEVRFALPPGEGEKGPQASAVLVIGKHHLPNIEATPT